MTHAELKEWIQYTQKRYILDDVDRQWATHNPSQKDQLTWQDYMNVTYGFMKGLATIFISIRNWFTRKIIKTLLDRYG